MIEITRVKINGISLEVNMIIHKNKRDDKRKEIANALNLSARNILFTYDEPE